MPTKSSRARRWVKQGKAVATRNDLEIYGVRLLSEPKARNTQDVALGIDPGKLFTGIGLVSAKATLFKAHLLENPVKGSQASPEHRKRKGGTVTPFGWRSGDKVKAEKAGQSCVGWIGGYVEKQKKVSVYDINWHRIGQFSVSKVQLVKRSTRLLSHVKVC